MENKQGFKITTKSPVDTGHYSSNAREMSKGRLSIDYYGVFWSGIFYRSFQMEQMGITPDFVPIITELYEINNQGKVLEERKAFYKVSEIKRRYGEWKSRFVYLQEK